MSSAGEKVISPLSICHKQQHLCLFFPIKIDILLCGSFLTLHTISIAGIMMALL
jgi:hypothetical protein